MGKNENYYMYNDKYLTACDELAQCNSVIHNCNSVRISEEIIKFLHNILSVGNELLGVIVFTNLMSLDSTRQYKICIHSRNRLHDTI